VGIGGIYQILEAVFMNEKMDILILSVNHTWDISLSSDIP
jgi:hypothetical protein